jgi:hypothetical protein
LLSEAVLFRTVLFVFGRRFLLVRHRRDCGGFFLRVAEKFIKFFSLKDFLLRSRQLFPPGVRFSP